MSRATAALQLRQEGQPIPHVTLPGTRGTKNASYAGDLPPHGVAVVPNGSAYRQWRYQQGHGGCQ